MSGQPNILKSLFIQWKPTRKYRLQFTLPRLLLNEKQVVVNFAQSRWTIENFWTLGVNLLFNQTVKLHNDSF